jgi:hypothetical protein|tara:strand:- start:423 stop:719 length:297 start_codon:yes stop_codon:yes gene_type:complete
MASFTITRRRLVVQVSTEEYIADTEQEALVRANQDQDGRLENDSDWDNTEAIDYPTLTSDDILEADELPQGVEAVCESCGKPCKYDSEICLCDECSTN